MPNRHKCIEIYIYIFISPQVVDNIQYEKEKQTNKQTKQK